ncbi:MAG: replicative DNA helicase [Clostridia bacterium]|nr:replicative DNA helicase [Clostridia bacterium]
MNNDFYKKVPVAIEAEQSVLGSILIKPECFGTVTGILSAEDFYMEEHQHIFNAMSDMFLSSRHIDPVTLLNALVQNGTYTEQNGMEYIAQIARIVPSAANVKDYANIVHEKSILRRLIGACDEISETAYGEQGEVRHIVDAAEQKIFEIAQNRESREFRHIRDIMTNVYSELENLAANQGKLDRTTTGFSGLDRVLVEMGKGDLILVGARPGMGKTSFAMNIATNVAKNSKRTVCIFSLEMSGEQLVNRMLSSEAMVDSHSLRSGELKNDDWPRLADAAAQLSGCDILVDDTTGVTVTDMKAKLRRVKNLGLVVIDYLQLMQSGKNIDNRVQEVGDISRNLKIMAKDLGVPVICCAQLSRGPESRTSKKPMLSDLRDSGAIEQDADVVIFLYRDEYYKDQEGGGQDAANTAEVIVAKNRHGSTDTVRMGWIGQFTKFRTLDEGGEPG